MRRPWEEYSRSGHQHMPYQLLPTFVTWILIYLYIQLMYVNRHMWCNWLGTCCAIHSHILPGIYKSHYTCVMMTSSNSFRVTGLCEGKSPVTRFDVFFNLRPNKRLSKQSWGWWFQTLSRPLWRQCNVGRTSHLRMGHGLMSGLAGYILLVLVDWNGNVVILTKFSLLDALKVAILVASGAGSDENLVEIMTFPFPFTVSPNSTVSRYFVYATTAKLSSTVILELEMAWLESQIPGQSVLLFCNIINLNLLNYFEIWPAHAEQLIVLVFLYYGYQFYQGITMTA